jgi:thioredoxin 1
MKIRYPTIYVFMSLCILISGLSEASANNYENLPVKGMVTMIDLGAKKCIPCKMMAPIMKKMEKAYKGKAAIVFIDVWENREQAKKFGIQGIPTQIFFNAQGKEVYRHVGFFSESAIIGQLKKIGVDPPENKEGK